MQTFAFQTIFTTAIAATGMLLAGSASAAGDCGKAGLDLPEGFCATVFASDVNAPRHIAVADNGTVYVNLARDVDGHGLMALKDTDGDGEADERHAFGDGGGTGLAIHDGWLYSATMETISRHRLGESMAPNGEPERIVTHLPPQNSHAARGFSISEESELFVNIGAPSNACQENDRKPGAAGQDPCPQLVEHAGIWRFSATETGQRFTTEARYATGLRNVIALAWHDGQLYGAQHGRDQLHSIWPDIFTEEQSVHLPAEELLAIDEGDNFGWPFCYYDALKNEKMLSPEYGGDGDKVGRCTRFEKPLAAYPAHWAPMDLLFYKGDGFGEKYVGGAFIAFHGSWNRAPSPQAGYLVAFQPLDGDRASGEYEDFAGTPGFTGKDTVRSPGSARHRPAGLAQGSDGALYISDDAGGTIFRVTRDDDSNG